MSGSETGPISPTDAAKVTGTPLTGDAQKSQTPVDQTDQKAPAAAAAGTDQDVERKDVSVDDPKQQAADKTAAPDGKEKPEAPATTPAVLEPATAVVPVSAEAQRLTKVIEGLSPQQQYFHELYQEVIAEARKLLLADPTQTKLAEALAVDLYLEGVTDPKSYNLVTADFIGPDDKPGNYNPHVRTIIDAVRKAGTGGKALGILNPRFELTGQGTDKEGYAMNTEVIKTEDVIQISCRPLIETIFESAQAQELEKEHPELLGRIAYVHNMLNHGKGTNFPDYVQLQIVNELLGELPPEFTSSVTFTEQTVDSRGIPHDSPPRSLKDAKKDVEIAHAMDSDGGTKDLFKEWLVNQMKNEGITPTAEEIASLPEKGLDTLTVLEIAEYKKILIAKTPAGRALGGIGVHLDSLVKTEYEILNKLVSKEGAVKRINDHIFGDRRLNEQTLGHDAAKLLGRLDPKKIPWMELGMGAMLLYGVMGPMMMSDDKEEQGGGG